MIKMFNKKSTWDAKYLPNFIVAHQLEVSHPMCRTRKVNIFDAHKIVPSDHMISSIPDEQVFHQKGKYINDPRIIKEVEIMHAFLHENFPKVRVRQK